jgi:gas vesicle protein GvpG
MFLLDSLLINGIRFALEKVAQVVDQELDNPERLQERLVEAQMQLEEGTLDEAAFAEIERDVFARLREMKGEAGGGIADAEAFDDVEVEIASDDTPRR